MYCRKVIDLKQLTYFVFIFMTRFCGASLTAAGAASLASALQKCPHISEIKYICFSFLSLLSPEPNMLKFRNNLALNLTS